MQSARNSSAIYVLASLGLMILACRPAAAERAYEAVTENCLTHTDSRIWSDGKGKTRSETKTGGMNQVSISDFNARVSWSINDQTKTITKVPFSDPSKPSPEAKWVDIPGVRMIDGHPCTGKRANMQGSVSEVWTGKDTDCSVLVTSNGTPVMKLKSWSARTPDPSLFNLPSGYKTVDMSEMMKNIQSGKFDPAAMQKLYKN